MRIEDAAEPDNPALVDSENGHTDRLRWSHSELR